ncbi:MAG: FAD-dependent oxidoreductase [Deltaproteobacteria bacterium]|jgi:NADPH-dependent glutamate synthase beta subunit-like oxidoreductase/coenzyme F420-reducing hydrogenase delta subunit/NAD-dependent dihydropyrimidine dehydrogenase PreA subunit|nr:FAD-dependent oxidoreductase [Deltaproteobacteria bacterium]MBT4267566.1 FAD-dependent oxidoreductase [Deltaproteobacteria bacterium]MBT4642347.1 FAD-dependent oxidoreductase [Deltaproteobacteria bacterium]MBT6502464.1 FAD-dependent oxidoreductase [Deltaproteobacteria bacterium]MBT7152286.1 FAD-dependent oxidoreductase [Deltaproteobacteria bacterium]
MSEKIHSILESENVILQLPDSVPGQFNLRRIEKSPCQMACPIDTPVKAYLGLIAAGEFEKAVEVVKRDNPFPGICGRVCIHPCENECERNYVDQPVAICYLKRFLADYEFKNGRVKVGKIDRKKKKQIAIVGSGPTGLTAANDLARSGYGVTVFEASAEPGGMLMHGISPFILPKNIVRFEIEGIKEWGVEIRTNVKIGVDISLETLQKNHHAILFAIGAHKALKPNIPGANKYKGIIDFLDFLKKVNRGEQVKINESIAVIGGDRASVDLARSAKRMGFQNVTIIYARSRTEMPVPEPHIQAAEEEGVKIYFQTCPVKIVGENGTVIGIECLKTESVLGPYRGKRPLPLQNSNFMIKADKVTSTINREPDLSSFQEKDHFRFSVLNSFSVDPYSLSTNIKGIFAAGDCATGPKTTIEAIASGRKAAKSIASYLKRASLKKPDGERQPLEYEVEIQQTVHEEQVKMPRLSRYERNTLKEVDLGFSAQEAMEEAKRCLKCGPCMECDICNPDCSKRLVILYPQGETTGSLLRVQYDSFPRNGQLMNGQLIWERKQSHPIEVKSLMATMNSEICRGCGDCVEVCLYSAPKLINRGSGVYISKIDEDLCRGCGVCPSVCPSSAITINYFSDSQLDYLSRESLVEKKIVAFICNWSYEMTRDIEQISNLNMIRVLCSARISSAQILKTFEQGAKGVLGIGCYEKACHYSAIQETTEHYHVAKKVIQTIGLEPQRIRFERLSPDQPHKINKIVRSFCKKIEDLK